MKVISGIKTEARPGLGDNKNSDWQHQGGWHSLSRWHNLSSREKLRKEPDWLKNGGSKDEGEVCGRAVDQASHGLL